jgi:hypothetical protein
MNKMDTSQRAKILIQAMPYIQKYSGETVVVKYGGNAMIDETLKQQVMEDIVLLWLIGVKIVLVHGGGPEINEVMDKYGKKPQFIDGLRVTDNAATNKTDSVIRLYNCKTDAGTCGVYILGNGEASEQKTQLIIEKSELKAEGFALCGGGNPDSRGTDIRIIGSTLKGTGEYSVGIYQPQKDGETVIFNSTIERLMNHIRCIKI